jgi:hypothetical protein
MAPAPPIVHDDLRAVIARVLAAEARAAFEEMDESRFKGSVAALVEMVVSPALHRIRS